MALVFTGGDGDKVDHGSGTTLDDLTVASYLFWCQPTSISDSATYTMLQKGTEPGQRRFILNDGSNNIHLEVFRATVVLSITAALSNFTSAGANKWLFVACLWDSGGADGDQRIFIGDLSTHATEPSSYGTQALGSGALSSDASANLTAWNHPAASQSFPGDGGWCGVWNRLLTAGEVRAQQFHPHKTSGNVLFCHYGYNGTGNQADLSGNGNTGTVTGAVVSDHVPLGPPFGFGMGWMGNFKAAAVATKFRPKVMVF